MTKIDQDANSGVLTDSPSRKGKIMAIPGAIVFMSPGVLTDAGGIVITVGSDGKLHIKRVPGWNPEVLSEVTAAVSVMNQAAHIKDANISRQLQTLAENVIQGHSKDIQGYMQQIAG